MSRFLAVLCFFTILAASCSSSADSAASTTSAAPTTTATTTTAPTTTEATTTTAEATTTEPETSPTEESAITFVESLLAVEWDEPNLGIGHNDAFFASVTIDPVQTRLETNAAERAEAEQAAVGLVEGDFLEIRLDRNQASVVYCTLEQIIIYGPDESIEYESTGTPILRDYQLVHEANVGWKMSDFFVGDECQR